MGLFALGEILSQLKNLGKPMKQVGSDERKTVLPRKGAFKGLKKNPLRFLYYWYADRRAAGRGSKHYRTGGI